jgi:hypothetical protein
MGLKPACPKCQRFYRPKKNGYYFMEGMPTGRAGIFLPGTQAPEFWQPYKLWVGDLWECLGCGAEIIVGTPSSPIAEHYQQHFAAAVEEFSPKVQINDC